ncbi:MAG: hypothetical protein LBR77_00565 [Lachnospiraceae bacterium]|nr:hypothetical protein [Lachnospiraceae bacterium]
MEMDGEGRAGTKVRLAYWDVVKGIGIAAIVLGHCRPTAFVYLYHLPLFFFVSGALYDASRHGRDPFGYLAGRMRGIWPKFVVYYSLAALCHNRLIAWGVYDGVEAYNRTRLLVGLCKALLFGYDEPIVGAMWFAPVWVISAGLYGGCVWLGLRLSDAWHAVTGAPKGNGDDAGTICKSPEGKQPVGGRAMPKQGTGGTAMRIRAPGGYGRRGAGWVAALGAAAACGFAGVWLMLQGVGLPYMGQVSLVAVPLIGLGHGLVGLWRVITEKRALWCGAGKHWLQVPFVAAFALASGYLLHQVNVRWHIYVDVATNQVPGGWFYPIALLGILHILAVARLVSAIGERLPIVTAAAAFLGRHSFDIMALHIFVFKLFDVVWFGLMHHDAKVNLAGFPTSVGASMWGAYLVLGLVVPGMAGCGVEWAMGKLLYTRQPSKPRQM